MFSKRVVENSYSICDVHASVKLLLHTFVKLIRNSKATAFNEAIKVNCEAKSSH